MKLHGDENKENRKQYHKSYREENHKTILENALVRKHERRLTDMNFKLRETLSSRIRAAIKNNVKSGTSIILLGCTIPELKTHLESNFKCGMSWDNYGLHGWHIDHIVPCVSFDLSKVEEQCKCFNFSNLQPLWARDNLSKGGKVIKNG